MLTALYGVMMAIIPRTIARYAIFRIVAGSRISILGLIASKVLFWSYAYMIAMIWYPNIQIVVGLCSLGLVYSLFSERRYILFPFRKTTSPGNITASSPFDKVSLWERIYSFFSIKKAS
ncbi:hypothetical protein bcgnr5372_40650 [Bacillus luti]|nr:hypothetical protein [Bacillus cereus]HDR8329064.1 hypothetical protein [Bacillus cereus]HDR8335818.1 hypothetical protein [Bacillus cereus]